jgi:hypothetical protein
VRAWWWWCLAVLGGGDGGDGGDWRRQWWCLVEAMKMVVHGGVGSGGGGQPAAVAVVVVASRRRAPPCVYFFILFFVRLNCGALQRPFDVISTGGRRQLLLFVVCQPWRTAKIVYHACVRKMHGKRTLPCKKTVVRPLFSRSDFRRWKKMWAKDPCLSKLPLVLQCKLLLFTLEYQST